jgi:hypothetical protein
MNLSVVSFIITEFSVGPAHSRITSGLAPLFIQYAPRLRTRAAFSRTALGQRAGLHHFIYCTHLVCVPAPPYFVLPLDKVQARVAFHTLRTSSAYPHRFLQRLWLRPHSRFALLFILFAPRVRARGCFLQRFGFGQTRRYESSHLLSLSRFSHFFFRFRIASVLPFWKR